MILRVLRRLAVQSYCLRRRAYSEPLRFILLGALSLLRLDFAGLPGVLSSGIVQPEKYANMVIFGCPIICLSKAMVVRDSYWAQYEKDAHIGLDRLTN